LTSLFISDGSGSKIFDPGRVGSGQFFVALVGSGQPLMVWVWIWKISPKCQIFQFFALRVKKNHFRLGLFMQRLWRRCAKSLHGKVFVWLSLHIGGHRVRLQVESITICKSHINFFFIQKILCQHFILKNQM